MRGSCRVGASRHRRVARTRFARERFPLADNGAAFSKERQALLRSSTSHPYPRAHALIAPRVQTYTYACEETSWMYDTGDRAEPSCADGASNGERVVDEGRRVAAGGKSGGVERYGARWDAEERKRRRARVGGRETERERAIEVGEQYLGDFALYLEMSFVGSISSTIRTLSLCPGVYRGVGSIRVYLCLQIDTRRTWVHTPVLPFLFASLFCLPPAFLLLRPLLHHLLHPIYVPAAAPLNYVRIG